jgi:hypothetical protein
MGILEDLDVQATAFWIDVPDTADFLDGGFQTQVPNQPRTGRLGGSQRRFESVRNAVRFVMEQLPLRPRATAMITTDYGMNYDIADIESAYASLSAPPGGASAKAEAGSFSQPKEGGAAGKGQVGTISGAPSGGFSTAFEPSGFNVSGLSPSASNAVLSPTSATVPPFAPATDLRTRQDQPPREPSPEVAWGSSARSGPRVILESRLSDAPEDIRNAANALAGAVKAEIDRLNASKPNDPDELAKHDAFVGFLEMVASELQKLADALDRALAARTSPEKERVLLGKAAQIVDRLQLGFDEFFEENRKHIAGFTVRVGLFAAAFGFLHACGVSGDISAVTSAVLNASIPTGSNRQR